MANAIQEKLTDLHHQAKENSIHSNNACKVLKKYIDIGKNTLDDIDNGKDFFTAIAFLNAQAKSPKIEHFIRKKLYHNAVRTSDGQGDGEKEGKYYEYKISTTNKNEKINALQIRLWQKIDYYILGYIDEKQFDDSRLYLVSHKNMKELCNKYGTATHGTKDVNDSNENVEMSFRIEMKIENDLLNFFESNFRANELESIIFN
ncbi:MAG: hypothetical protein FWG85_05210 [Bacteroidetes bacterium]|nr:hypothetical protein [Bacteroidota bacterium]